MIERLQARIKTMVMPADDQLMMYLRTFLI